MKEAAPIVEQTSAPAKQNEVESTKQFFKDSNPNANFSADLLGAGDVVDHPYDFSRLPIHAEENNSIPISSDTPPVSNSQSTFANHLDAREEEVSSVAHSPQSILQNLGKGQALSGNAKSRMEAAYGQNFSDVEVHTDSRAAALSKNMNARAFAVGNHIAFANGEYNPGTLVGDALLAHELAHVIQQENAVLNKGENTPTVESNSLERDADFSAVGVISKLWGSTFSYLKNVSARAMPAVRSGLQLQRCGYFFGEDEEEIERTVMQNLRAEGEWDGLLREIRNLSPADLAEAQSHTTTGTRIGRAVRFDKGYRDRDWSTMVALLQLSEEEYQEAYKDDFVTLIMSNATTINIRGNRDFASYIDSAFYELCELPSGFRLIIELLVTGQSVTIEVTSEGDQTRAAGGDPDAGHLHTEDDSFQAVPLAEQRPTAGVGSVITMNPDLSGRRMVLSRTDGQVRLIELNDALTLGHELIHALHRAQGNSIGAPSLGTLTRAFGQPNYLVRDPDTGTPQDPEELRTVSGRTRFSAPTEAGENVTWAVEFNLDPADQISENMLREEAGLDLRFGYSGATHYVTKERRIGATTNQLLNDYYLEEGGTIPAEVMTEIRALLLDLNPIIENNAIRAVGDMTTVPINYPHPNYVRLHMQYVRTGTSEATNLLLEKLKLR